MKGSMMGEKAAHGWWHNSEGEAGRIEKKLGSGCFSGFPLHQLKWEKLLSCVWVSLLLRKKA